ncbi:MAG: hypothetical protein AAF585_24100, partial [Verrucomicrobiota bacterium]
LSELFVEEHLSDAFGDQAFSRLRRGFAVQSTIRQLLEVGPNLRRRRERDLRRFYGVFLTRHALLPERMAFKSDKYNEKKDLNANQF